MRPPQNSRRWHRIAQAALLGFAALAAVPFILVALFSAAGGRR
jgi:hypothetical protein